MKKKTKSEKQQNSFILGSGQGGKGAGGWGVASLLHKQHVGLVQWLRLTDLPAH